MPDRFLDAPHDLGRQRHGRCPDDRAGHRGQAADDDHREEVERLREEELLGVEGQVVLGPDRAAHAHDRAREHPRHVAQAHDVRAQRLGGHRVRAARAQLQPGVRLAEHAADEDRDQREDHGREQRGVARDPEHARRAAGDRVPVVEDDEEDHEHADRGHRHRALLHARQRRRRSRRRRARRRRWRSAPPARSRCARRRSPTGSSGRMNCLIAGGIVSSAAV